MSATFQLGDDFIVDVDNEIICDSHACDMQKCLLGRAVKKFITKRLPIPACMWNVSAQSSGVFIAVEYPELKARYEYVFDRLTWARIANFDNAFELAIANGKDQEEAHAYARSVTKPFQARAKYMSKKIWSKKTPAELEKQAERKKELAILRSSGAVPAPTPRPARTASKGRRTIRGGYKAKA